MGKEVITILLCFVLAFSIMGSIEAKKTKEKCDLSFVDSGINEVLNEINSNPQYLDFIKNLGYSAVRLNLAGEDYYFVYADDQVKQVDIANEDFKVKVSCNEMNKIIEAYNNKDAKLKKMVIKQLPFSVKVSVFNQCMNVDWCKEKVF